MTSSAAKLWYFNLVLLNKIKMISTQNKTIKSNKSS